MLMTLKLSAPFFSPNDRMGYRSDWQRNICVTRCFRALWIGVSSVCVCDNLKAKSSCQCSDTIWTKRRCTLRGVGMQILVTSMAMGKICIENNIQGAKTDKGEERGRRGAYLGRVRGEGFHRGRGRDGAQSVSRWKRVHAHLTIWKHKDKKFKMSHNLHFLVNSKQMDGILQFLGLSCPSQGRGIH